MGNTYILIDNLPLIGFFLPSVWWVTLDFWFVKTGSDLRNLLQIESCLLAAFLAYVKQNIKGWWVLRSTSEYDFTLVLVNLRYVDSTYTIRRILGKDFFVNFRTFCTYNHIIWFGGTYKKTTSGFTLSFYQK